MMKVQIQISSFDADPKEVFQALENRRSEIEWAQRKEKPDIPKQVFERKPPVPISAGVYNLVRQFLP